MRIVFDTQNVNTITHDRELQTRCRFKWIPKELILEKLKREEKNEFLHKYLKTMQYFLNDLCKIVFFLDSKGDHLNQKRCQFSPCWNNTIGEGMKSAKLRKAKIQHKLPTFKINNLHGMIKKMMSYECTSEIENISHTRFCFKCNAMLRDGMSFTIKGVMFNNDKEIHRSKEHNFATVTDERKPWSILFLPRKIKCNIILELLCAKLDEFEWEYLLQ